VCRRRAGATPAEGHADDDCARGPVRAPVIDLEDAQVEASALRLTGLAGTTVEMACL
jgi:hypothetical protein